MNKTFNNLVKPALILSLFLAITSCQTSQKDIWIAETPAQSEYAKIDRDGTTIIPNGRKITPVGKTITTAPHPYGLALSSDGNLAVTANSGTNPLSITIIRDLQGNNPEVQQIPPGANTDRGILDAVFMGLAVHPNGRDIFVSGGQSNNIYIFDALTGEKTGAISCHDSTAYHDYSHGYIGDMVLSLDGKTLYAVDQIGFRMVILDVEKRQIIRNVPVGRYPFGICLSRDGKKAYVANVGMYQYSFLEGLTTENAKEKALPFPPFGYNTPESKEGVTIDGTKVPGLGETNTPEMFSVFAVEIEDAARAEVVAKIKTGNLVGQIVDGVPAVGGSSPNSLVATDRYIFVSNGNNDNISVIDMEKDTVVQTIYLKPDPRMKQFRGVIPFGLALSPDHNRLYVAESGINAVAVIDVATLKVLGHIPTGWFPAKLKVTSDGKHLIVTNAKGYGSGPNGGHTFERGPEGSYIGNLMKGSVSIIPIPDAETLKDYTATVVANNWDFKKADDERFAWRTGNPIPLYPGKSASPIKHIVFVSKENRTYDEVFGQIEAGRGDSSIARFGLGQRVVNRKGEVLESVDVMPNHHKLAREFAIADNFYVDADVSADGHRWLVNTYPNEWVETTTAASYGGNRNFRYDSKAPGVLAMNGAAGAIYPEDYNEAGSMWDHLERNGVDFFNFGFSVMFEPALYDPDFKYSGIGLIANFPVPTPLEHRSSRQYPTYNMAIPDQFRTDQFIKEFTEKYIEGPDTMPELLTVILPNDHGAGERPEAGYPYFASYQADNDLALGRMVEFLSSTPYWENMIIVVTEDDAQGGVDHIDAHRSILMVISPWARKNYVGHQHYSFGSIFKSFWNILGLPYLNQYDAGATDLADLMSDEPDLSPYRAVPVDSMLFDPQTALDPFDEEFDWKALDSGPALDDVEVMLEQSKEQDEWRLENREAAQ